MITGPKRAGACPHEDLEHILTHIGAGFSALNGSSFFITGATGFIGRWITEALLAANEAWNMKTRICVLTRDSAKFSKVAPHICNNPALSLINGDVRSFTLPATRFSHLIHAAADTQMTRDVNSEKELTSVIEDGAMHIADLAASHTPQKLLFLSSGQVYYPHTSPQKYREDESTVRAAGGASPYGMSKLNAELLLCDRGSKVHFDVIVARCFAFIGPFLPLDGHFAAGNFIRDLIMGRPIGITGNPLAVRSYLYTADLVIWLLNILTKGKPFHPYNVGSEEPVTIGQLASTVAACAPAKVREVTISAKPDTNAPFDYYVPSTARAREELGLRQTISLATAVSKTVNFYLKNQ